MRYCEASLIRLLSEYKEVLDAFEGIIYIASLCGVLEEKAQPYTGQAK